MALLDELVSPAPTAEIVQVNAIYSVDVTRDFRKNLGPLVIGGIVAEPQNFVLDGYLYALEEALVQSAEEIQSLRAQLASK